MLAAEPPPLVSDEQYQAFVGSAPTQDQQTRLLAASASIRRRCGWHIAPVVSQTFTVDGPRGTILTLPTLRLVDVIAVSNDGVAADVSTVEWSHDGQLRGSWSSRFRGVQVTILHGFEDVDDLVQLVVELSRRVQPKEVAAKTIGNRSVTYREPGLMQYERDQVAHYRLPWLS